MNNRERLVVVIPAYNEEGKIGRVVSKIKMLENGDINEVLVVNDFSRDNTELEAKQVGAKVITHDHNKGAGAAIRTGIDYALENKFDIIVVMGGDDQDESFQIKRLLAPIISDHFDFVQGSRYIAGGERVNIPIFRWITTGIYSLIFKVFIRFPVSDGTNGFRAFRASIFKDKRINLWQRWLDRYELEPYLFYKAVEYGYKVTEVPVTKKYPDEKIGYTKMVPIIDWWSILSPLIYLRLGIKK